MVLIVMYSKFGEQILKTLKKLIVWLLYESTIPRRWIWNRYYDLRSWIYPDDSFYIMNSGYALISNDGLINKITPIEHEAKEIYQYQLYYAVANMIKSSVFSKAKVVDLS